MFINLRLVTQTGYLLAISASCIRLMVLVGTVLLSRFEGFPKNCTNQSTSVFNV